MQWRKLSAWIGSSLIIGTLAGCSPKSSPALPVSMPTSAPRLNPQEIAKQWEYPLLVGAPSAASYRDTYSCQFRTDDTFPKVQQYYGKKCGITGKIAPNSSGTEGHSSNNTTTSVAYQNIVTDRLQVTNFAFQDNTTRVTTTISQAKGDKYTVVSISAWAL